MGNESIDKNWLCQVFLAKVVSKLLDMGGGGGWDFVASEHTSFNVLMCP